MPQASESGSPVKVAPGMAAGAKAAADPLAAATAETTELIATLDGIAAAPLTLTQFLCARVLADAAQRVREVAQHQAEHVTSNAEGRSECQPLGINSRLRSLMQAQGCITKRVSLGWVSYT